MGQSPKGQSMKPIRALFLLATVTGLSACATFDTATKNARIGSRIETTVAAPTVPSYSVAEVRVNVPETLRVSEANLYYPIADIVWRGDRYGNRYEQVAAIFEEGIGAGAAQLEGKRPVVAEIEVRRFHSLTEVARYTFGGVHSIKFMLTVRDAKTGDVIDGPRLVNADLDAFGGGRAVAAEREGLTQRVRIVRHLSDVIQRELMRPVVVVEPSVATAQQAAQQPGKSPS